MISFGQFIVLLGLVFLLFGDIRKIFNKAILFFVNLKTLLQKPNQKDKDKSD